MFLLEIAKLTFLWMLLLHRLCLFLLWQNDSPLEYTYLTAEKAIIATEGF